MLLHNYLNHFRQQLKKLEDYGFSESIEIKEEIRAKKLAVITAHIVLLMVRASISMSTSMPGIKLKEKAMLIISRITRKNVYFDMTMPIINQH